MPILKSKDHNEIQLWRNRNPSGYICNCANPIIHRVNCDHHLGSISLQKQIDFDLGKNEKILSESYSELIEYLSLENVKLKFCSHCMKKYPSDLDYKSLNLKQKKLLAFFLTRPDKSATASEIAEKLGYKNPGAVNFEVWRIAEILSPSIGYTPDSRDDGSKRWWPALFYGTYQEDGSFLWTLKPEIEILVINFNLISYTSSASFKNTENDFINTSIVNDASPPKGITNPRSIYQSTKVFERDRSIKTYLIATHGCSCEVCGWKSDIIDEHGNPYIEMHHLKMLSEGGTDTLSNAILVCPNCHRRLHYSGTRNELLENLYTKISRLIREL